jgi:hypothetical protein
MTVRLHETCIGETLNSPEGAAALIFIIGSGSGSAGRWRRFFGQFGQFLPQTAQGLRDDGFQGWAFSGHEWSGRPSFAPTRTTFMIRLALSSLASGGPGRSSHRYWPSGRHPPDANCTSESPLLSPAAKPRTTKIDPANSYDYYIRPVDWNFHNVARRPFLSAIT